MSRSSSSTDRPLLEVGRVGRPHGLRGDVLVRLTTDQAARVDPGSELCVAGSGRTLVVASARPHQERWIVRFAGVDDRAAAESLRGAVLQAEPLDEPGSLWVHEVVGTEVFTPDGASHGRVVAVHANPAHDLLELDDGTLVPVVFLVDDPTGADRLVVEPPPGLLP